MNFSHLRHMAKVGLLFGSFNPIHQGHLIIAEYFVTHGYDWIELVVSPQNPLKSPEDLAPSNHRLAMARLAVRGNQQIRVNAIEFSMPQPSFTYRTLQSVRSKYPENQYQLIIGSDNFDKFRQWKDWEKILDEYKITCYRRPGFEGYDLEEHRNVEVIEDAPMIYLSASYIRQCVRQGKSVRYLVPEASRKYLAMHGLYLKGTLGQ